ncbi:U-box domain-containing protein 33-like isoform X2 [Silene latifolia]|uniref:U-box domain-containing protein 33-like isoform X2 n=1 Tax=Silene latifolia TaxID=37657 RepID=UPI003D786971
MVERDGFVGVGKLPANRANPLVVAAYRKDEREKMNDLLQYYLNTCQRAKVKVSFIVTEADKVHKGLVELVLNHNIRKLIMGSVSRRFEKVTKNSSKANYAAKNTPAFCEIWFIYKGEHVWTREAFEVPSSCQEEKSSPKILRSKSFQHRKRERLYNPDHLQFSSSRLSVNGPTTEDFVPSHSSCSPVNSLTSNDSTSITSSERKHLSDFETKLEEETLYAQLLEVKAEAETLKTEAFAELLKREKLEAEAIQAMRKVKAIELIYSREAKLRMEAEDALRSMIHEQEILLEERLEVTGQLQKTMRNVAVLDCRVQEANRRCEEVYGELKHIQVCTASLRLERQRLWKQKVEADRWLEKWRSGRQTSGTNRRVCGGILDDVPDLVEFSLLDLQSATCNFSESFKMCERGFCSVYKGELLGRTITIQRLHAHNIQAPSQFQKEVEVLGNLRHPHLINLVGACPEAWSIVYDYVPDTLQSRLFQKRNILPWKIRARIISEISTALLFLHTSHPEKIVHGDLQPENILLDPELHCKLCDFGISRLLSQDNIDCPNFRYFPESKGAFPYTDPELHRAGLLSPKSDVYAFGVVMLQLLTGLPPVGLVANARRAVSSGRLVSILDPSAGNWGPFVAEKLADTALRFCEPNSRDRPELTPSVVKELQQLHMSQEQPPAPSFFLCPILQEIMGDPQVAADGFTYEGEAIREWLENGRETSPMTNLKLDHLHLTANHALRLAIQEWLCKY